MNSHFPGTVIHHFNFFFRLYRSLPSRLSGNGSRRSMCSQNEYSFSSLGTFRGELATSLGIMASCCALEGYMFLRCLSQPLEIYQVLLFHSKERLRYKSVTKHTSSIVVVVVLHDLFDHFFFLLSTQLVSEWISVLHGLPDFVCFLIPLLLRLSLFLRLPR
jgi:hypothetical protein